MDFASDNRTSDAAHDALHGLLGELKELAGAWNSPVGLYNYLRRLISEKPLVGLAASVAVGAMLGGRFLRHRRAVTH
jgi:hypothetical protein